MKENYIVGLSSLGVPWHPQFLADQLTLSQPRGADYAHQIYSLLFSTEILGARNS